MRHTFLYSINNTWLQPLLSQRRTQRKCYRLLNYKRLSISCNRYKQHVLCYLLSHVIGCPIPEKKISLLGTVKDVSSKAKSQTLQPVLEALSSEKTSAQLVQLLGKSYDEFATLVISSVDETAVEALNKPEDLWSVYQTILRHYFHPGKNLFYLYDAASLDSSQTLRLPCGPF